MRARLEEIDHRTLRRASRGEREAATAFVRRYERLVFATVGRVLGPGSADVGDAAQETFLRAFGALGTFDPDGVARVSTWLSTIAVRVALDATRRRRRVVSLDEARAAVDGSPPPDVALDEARQRARLAAAMARLGPDQRAAMVLRIEHDLPLSEIARILEVQVGTVKSRLSRARAELSAALGAETTRTSEEHDARPR